MEGAHIVNIPGNPWPSQFISLRWCKNCRNVYHLPPSIAVDKTWMCLTGYTDPHHVRPRDAERVGEGVEVGHVVERVVVRAAGNAVGVAVTAEVRRDHVKPSSCECFDDGVEGVREVEVSVQEDEIPPRAAVRLDDVVPEAVGVDRSVEEKRHAGEDPLNRSGSSASR